MVRGRKLAGGVGGRVAAGPVRALRPPMRSPGRPEPSRAVQREFWRLIASGVTTVQAAESVGVMAGRGPLVPSRWRHAADQPRRAQGAVLVVGGAGGDRAAACQGDWRA
jgi:hypothetical protein